ncbi:MAG: ABC transporter permease [Methanoregula sp.]|jgi:ABC-2 type transport system permease protein|nr:ABC transporter permease [Methanoregula sp.]
MSDSGVVITIAKKEFLDHLRSRRFLIILGILLIIACVAILNGVSEYNAKVKEYDSMQQFLPTPEEDNSPTLTFLRLQPSVLLVFFQMSTLFAVIGGILGIAMGFDLVTREKESKSLKLLLAHPTYRDEVINGKALGGIAAIALALGIVIISSLALLLILGILPDGTELAIISLFSAVTFLYIFTCFAIALLMSTLCEESGKALIYSLIIFVVLGSLVPAIVSSSLVMGTIIGEKPEMPGVIIDQMMGLAELPENQIPTQNSTETKIGILNRDAWDSYNQKIREYGDRQIQFRDIQYLVSPTRNYEKITTCLTSPTWTRYILYMITGESLVQKIDNQGRRIWVSINYEPKIDFDFSGILALVIGNIIALLILPCIFFGLAYVSFMKMDIR